MSDYISKYLGSEIEERLDYASDIPRIKERLTTTENDISEIKSEAQNTSESIRKLTENDALLKQQLDITKKEIEEDVLAIETHLTTAEGEIYELKGDLINVKAGVSTKASQTDLDRTNLYLDALFKLDKGQTWDTLEPGSEAYSVDVPNGTHYAGVDMIGGKSVVWNQLCNYESGEVQSTKNYQIVLSTSCIVPSLHKYYFSGFVKGSNGTDIWVAYSDINLNHGSNAVTNSNDWTKLSNIGVNDANYSGRTLKIFAMSGNTVSWKNLMLIDLTQMFGAGNEPATVEEFEAIFPDDYYPYCEPTIISSQTDRVDVASAAGTIIQKIETGFPALNNLDSIELNDGKLITGGKFVDLSTLNFIYNESSLIGLPCFYAYLNEIKSGSSKNMCGKYVNKSQRSDIDGNMQMAIGNKHDAKYIVFRNDSYKDETAFKEAMSGVMLYYELENPVITDIEIPTGLSDWLIVEAGGSITFHNKDDGNRFAIPNKETFILKLDEVSV